MRPICAILIVFTVTGSLYAQEEPQVRKMINLIYSKGYLVNQGTEDILQAEVTSPFYRYLGDIPKGQKVNVTNIQTKFTVRFTARKWLGEEELMEKVFIPEYESVGLDVGLQLMAKLAGEVLSIKVTSKEEIRDIFIEILSDMPVKISEDRVRYVLSNVGVKGQSLKSGPEASFKLYLINDQAFYKVPVDISYVYQGQVYERVFFFSFTREEFRNAAKAP